LQLYGFFERIQEAWQLPVPALLSMFGKRSLGDSNELEIMGQGKENPIASLTGSIVEARTSSN